MPLTLDIDIAVIDPKWSQALSDIDMICQQAIEAIFTRLDTPQIGELSLALMDDTGIKALNRTYRNKDKPTNVLSFPVPDPHTPLLGDIVLALETVKREAVGRGLPLQDHFTHLLIHGYLHLQGFTHESETEAQIMEGLEITALKSLGIDNPYENNRP